MALQEAHPLSRVDLPAVVVPLLQYQEQKLLSLLQSVLASVLHRSLQVPHLELLQVSLQELLKT